MSTETVVWTDEATIGRQLVILVINDSGQTLNPGTQTFGARTSGCEISMTERPDYPGTHFCSVPLPDDAGPVFYRVEEQGDTEHVPIGSAARPVVDGVVSNLGDILGLIVPSTGTDGGGDVSVGRLLLELLSVAKGMWLVDKATGRFTLHLLGTNEVLRTFRRVDNAQESARKPPDAV